MFDHTRFISIKAMLFDVDGVFTNSEVLVTEEGYLLRTMNTRDGQAIKYALDQGFIIGIITKGLSNGVRKRFELLGIRDVHDGVLDKSIAFQEIVANHALDKEEILYMGDDIPDLALFENVGLSACPSDAVNDVISKADFVSAFKGGHGCVRDIIERVMRIQNKWPV